MRITGIADPKQLAMLGAVLDDVCAEAGIGVHAPEREAAASLVMKFYWRGYRNVEDLKSAIEEAIREEASASGSARRIRYAVIWVTRLHFGKSL